MAVDEIGVDSAFDKFSSGQSCWASGRGIGIVFQGTPRLNSRSAIFQNMQRDFWWIVKTYRNDRTAQSDRSIAIHVPIIPSTRTHVAEKNRIQGDRDASGEANLAAVGVSASQETDTLAAPQSSRDGMQSDDISGFVKLSIILLLQFESGMAIGTTTRTLVSPPARKAADLNGLDVSYTSLRASLTSHEASALDQAFVNSLPNASSVNGVSTFYVSSALTRPWACFRPPNGAVGIGTQIPSTLLVGLALHELTHAMGREPGAGTFDLPAPAAYFSINGGNTKLADFGQNSDPSDLLNSEVQGASDPFDEYYSSITTQSLTT